MTPHRRLRCALPLGLLGALLASFLPLATAPAAADDGGRVPPGIVGEGPLGSLTRDGAIEQRASAYLCTGYAGCAQAGYSNAGYQRVSDKMFWRMYAGHNCTNYAAYRMVKSGLPNVRPWSGGGNASQWGVEMSEITDQVPTVGAVAWYRANVPGAGSAGHVAYVEQVISPTEIVISEDSWGGDFHWRRLRKADGPWPSGFIHFNDVTLTNLAAPVVSGTPQVGEPLTAAAGTWSPTGTYAFQWLSDGAAVAGATTSRFVPTAAQRGERLTVQVTATKKGYSPVSVRTPTTADVRIGTMRNEAPPTISGTPEVDEVLTATPGAWAPGAEETTVQWYADGVAIPGATGWSLRLAQPQIDTRVTAAVSARTTAYKPMKVVSAATTPVIAGTIAVTRKFTVEGTARVGSTLSAASGEFQPADAAITYTWLRDGVAIAGADDPTYTLRPEDVGGRISVRVDLARQSYRSTSQTSGATARVTTVPILRLYAKGRPGAALVVMRVDAPGIASPTGKIVVRIGRFIVHVNVVDGRARLRVPHLVKGPKKVVALYSGTTLITKARATTKVWVKRG